MGYRFHKIPRTTSLKCLNEDARKALITLLPKTDDEIGDQGPEHESWIYYYVGRAHKMDIFIAAHHVSGPREPDLVWTGVRWICSEDELSESERELMKRVAQKCPGGLGGWS